MHNYENVNSAELLLTATTDKSMLIINWAGISTRTSTKTATKRTKKAAYLTIALGDVGELCL